MGAFSTVSAVHMRHSYDFRRPGDLPLRVKGLALVIVPLLVLAVTVVASVRVTQEQDQFQGSVHAAVDTSDLAGQTLITLLSAETGVRGYVATGDRIFLQPWTTAHRRLPAQLARLTSDSLVDTRQRAELTSLSRAEMSELQGLVQSDRSGSAGRAALDGALLSGKAKMDRLRTVVAGVQAGVQRVLAQRRSKVSSLRSTGLVIAIIGLGVGLLGVLAMFLFIRRVAHRVDLARVNAQRLGIGEALVDAAPGGDELGRLSAELSQASSLLSSRSADLINAHRAALAAARNKDRFLSELGHEMRTPLTAIAGFGQLLEASDDLTGDDAESASHIVHAANHLIALTNDIGADPGQDPTLLLSETPARIDDVAREVRGLMAAIAADKHITLRVEVDPAFVVIADPKRLSQVLINLVSNAIKYNRVGGEVRIHARAGAARTIRVSVTDSGIGIRAELQPRVFVPFERLDQADGPVDGRGIGLALSRTYIEAMGGSIGLESEEGRGTTFWIELPRAEDAHPAALEA